MGGFVRPRALRALPVAPSGIPAAVGLTEPPKRLRRAAGPGGGRGPGGFQTLPCRDVRTALPAPNPGTRSVTAGGQRLAPGKVVSLGTGFCCRSVAATKPVSDCGGLPWFVFNAERVADVSPGSRVR